MPAADAPCPEQAFNATALKWHTCAWLLLPVLVFLAGWMHWYAALPLTLLTAAGLAPRKRKEPQTRDSLPAFPLFTRSSFLALAAFAALMALSGWGEWVNQHPDHIVRNACLRELVASPWPVIFPDGNVLIYNTGFWLVPALAGKLAPYTVIFFALCMLMNTCLFKFLSVPLQGNVMLLFVSGLVYVMVSQAIGVFMIAALSNLRLALSIGGGYSVLSFTFSGLTFPFMAMDLPLQIFGYIFPMTYYVEIFIDQAMRGAPPVYTINYLGYMSVFILLPVVLLPRLKRICTDEKYWGRL